MAYSSAQSKSKIEDLDKFLRAHGASRPNIEIAESREAGLHWKAKKDIEPGDTVISVPHKLAFSYLNAIVDEDWPIFKRCRGKFQADFEVEAITFFYFMTQYLNREKSFWRPYLNALPGPEEEHTQPLFYEDAEDVAMLEGTDVWHTNLKRRERYRAIHDDALKVLQMNGCDTSTYTWHLFKWTAATFTSRSFSSRALRPQDSNYWAAYRHGKDGRSQTVLLDMSHTSASDFPVLFPGLDIGNHSNEAKIDYVFDSGRFDIKTNSATKAGYEVFNNYGPKSNDELLLGYGFCIPGNRYNAISLLLKEPPAELQQHLREFNPAYFSKTSEGSTESKWDPEKGTFQILGKSATDVDNELFQCLPEPLLELLAYILRHERGYDFEFIENARDYLSSTRGSCYLPHVANIVMASLVSKMQKLNPQRAFPRDPSGELGFDALTPRQQQAFIYIRDVRSIVRSLIARFQTYFQRLLARAPDQVTKGHRLVRLEVLVQHLEQFNRLPSGFKAGLMANANTDDLEQLRLAGWEQDIWILLLHAMSLEGKGGWPSPGYTNFDPHYLEAKGRELQRQPDDPSHGLLELVRTAAEACPDSVWSIRWDAASLCEWTKVLQFDGFEVMCADSSEDSELRLCVYMHDTMTI